MNKVRFKSDMLNNRVGSETRTYSTLNNVVNEFKGIGVSTKKILKNRKLRNDTWNDTKDWADLVYNGKLDKMARADNKYKNSIKALKNNKALKGTGIALATVGLGYGAKKLYDNERNHKYDNLYRNMRMKERKKKNETKSFGYLVTDTTGEVRRSQSGKLKAAWGAVRTGAKKAGKVLGPALGVAGAVGTGIEVASQLKTQRDIHKLNKRLDEAGVPRPGMPKKVDRLGNLANKKHSYVPDELVYDTKQFGFLDKVKKYVSGISNLRFRYSTRREAEMVVEEIIKECRKKGFEPDELIQATQGKGKLYKRSKRDRKLQLLIRDTRKIIESIPQEVADKVLDENTELVKGLTIHKVENAASLVVLIGISALGIWYLDSIRKAFNSTTRKVGRYWDSLSPVASTAYDTVSLHGSVHGIKDKVKTTSMTSDEFNKNAELLANHFGMKKDGKGKFYKANKPFSVGSTLLRTAGSLSGKVPGPVKTAGTILGMAGSMYIANKTANDKEKLNERLRYAARDIRERERSNPKKKKK